MLIPKYVKYKCISSHCFFVVILFIVLGACDTKREIKTPKKFIDKCELKQVDSLLFELDSSTPYGTQSIQFVSHKDSSYLAYLNEQNATIYLYNLKSPKNPKTINFLNKEKYNFTKIHGLYIHSLDSIFILNGYRLFLSDIGGNIIKTYPLIDKSIYQTSSNPTMGTLAPAKLIGNTLYISAMPDKDFFNSNYFESNELKILLNIKTGQFKYAFSYPNSYKNEVWGNNLAYFFHTYNEDKNIFVYSFSIDENIYSTNHGNLLNTFYAGSKFFTKSKPMEGITKDFQKRLEYYLRQPSYFAIYYDKYRKLYYRIAHQPTSEEDIINQNYIKHTSIIILDNNFTKIGETLLPKYGYTETMCFITKDGLYIAKPNKENENILSFGLFKIFDKYE